MLRKNFKTIFTFRTLRTARTIRTFRFGFTLIEALTIVGILIVLTGISVPALRFFQTKSSLVNSSEEIAGALRLARSKAISSEGASQWGVYFSTSTVPNSYTLFRGASYISRATSSDRIYNLPKLVRINLISFTPIQKEVVFDRITGTANASGAISLALTTGSLEGKNIYISNSGQIDTASSSAPSDQGRAKDSRHVHFNYSRQIATSSEKLILTFAYGTSTVLQEIFIADNLKDGQIFWEGQVSVGGEMQALKIYTHRLNSPDSQFSINRDRRYNQKALAIRIDGDITGGLISYDASEGLTTKGASIYVASPEWQ
ncbi:MAG: hypothetical protein Q7K28_01660 [Candidatus Wildermuthbacteria bacterium]|nr:hypothetical protein [Candidatus Wildermuthbacteria bacterium]